MRLKARIVEHHELAGGFRHMLLDAPCVASHAVPGQFVHVLCSDSYDPLLRRPFSLQDADPHSGQIAILYEIRGRGTRLLAARAVGENVDILGPLGQGFQLPENPKQEVVLVAGGIGVPPISFLARVLQSTSTERKVSALIGSATSDKLVCVEEIAGHGCECQVSTDDGSSGYCGFITDLLEENLSKQEGVQVYACGPMPMLAEVARTTARRGVKCQVSVEAKMACGVGACMSCVIKVRLGDSFKYVRACKEGPVFGAEEVIWE